ncbi:MAG: PEP-CTERM sorting domain-containing protein [Pirellulales bacterium]
MKNRIVVGAFAAAYLAVAGVNAATVTLSLVKDPAAVGCTGCTLSGPGTYQLFAESSADDNQGIVGYGISIQNVSTVLHRAPRVSGSETPDGDVFPAGFTLLRSGNNQVPTGSGFLIGAGQDTVTPTPYLIQGFGQTPGSWVASLPAENTNSGIIQPSWSGKLLLAEGTYQAGAAPSVDLANVDVFANVIVGSGVEKASLVLGGQNGIPLVGDKAVDWFSQNPPVANSDSLSLTDDGPVGVWSIDSFTAPNGVAPSIDPSTGLFTWIGNGSPAGTYPAVLKYTDGLGASDTGTLSITWHIPEPSTFALFGLALIGFAGCRRK